MISFKRGNMGVPTPVLLYSILLTLSFQGLLESCLSKEIACLHDPPETLEIACPKGRVIMWPKVKVGKMASRPDSAKCKPNLEKDCLGTTPEVLAQINQCHFLQVCIIRLNQFMPITDSDNRSCLTERPDYAFVESFECICQQTLQFACKEANEDPLVSHMEGTLVSHRNYPWNYRTDGGFNFIPCRLYFATYPDFMLNMWTTDLDLDPDFRDKLSLYNVSVPGDKESIGHFPVKSQPPGFNLTFTFSMIELVFSRTRYSKAGRGFVVKYKWIPIKGESAATETSEICLESRTMSKVTKIPPSVTEKPKKRRQQNRKDRKNKRRGKKNRKPKSDRQNKDENPQKKRKRKQRRRHKKEKKTSEDKDIT